MIQTTFLFALAGFTSLSIAAPTNFIKRQDSSCKRGLAFGKNAQSKTDLFNNGPACWGYDWESRVADSGLYTLSNYEYVPMLHDNSETFKNVWHDDVEKAIKAGSTHVLSFNEPDQAGGGGTNIPVNDAVAAHKELVQPYAGRVKIGAPAVTNGDGANKGLGYLQQFLAGCSDCQIDFVCAHWYWPGATGTVDQFKKQITNVHTTTGKPVWVTEWQAPVDNTATQFVKEVMKWMDETDFVERYAYQSVDTTLTAGNALSEVGKAYAAA